MQTERPFQPCSPCTALMCHALAAGLRLVPHSACWVASIRTLPAAGHALLRGACILTSYCCCGVCVVGADEPVKLSTAPDATGATHWGQQVGSIYTRWLDFAHTVPCCLKAAPACQRLGLTSLSHGFVMYGMLGHRVHLRLQVSTCTWCYLLQFSPLLPCPLLRLHFAAARCS